MAFVTDRYSTDLPTLAFTGFGSRRSTLGDGRDDARSRPVCRATRSTRSGRATDARCSSSPTPAAARTSYRLDLARGRRRSRSRMKSPASPASRRSVRRCRSRRAAAAAVSVFRAGGYEIQLLDATTVAPAPRRRATSARRGDAAAGQAPAESGHASARAAGGRDCRRRRTFTSRRLQAGAVAHGVGQQVGVVDGRVFGTYVSGGISFLFSDMLGDHIARREPASTAA